MVTGRILRLLVNVDSLGWPRTIVLSIKDYYTLDGLTMHQAGLTKSWPGLCLNRLVHWNGSRGSPGLMWRIHDLTNVTIRKDFGSTTE
jgi:hypothetical protein